MGGRGWVGGTARAGLAGRAWLRVRRILHAEFNVCADLLGQMEAGHCHRQVLGFVPYPPAIAHVFGRKNPDVL